MYMTYNTCMLFAMYMMYTMGTACMMCMMFMMYVVWMARTAIRNMYVYVVYNANDDDVCT